MKIVVTGANGFLGAHLIGSLLKEGHEVTAFVRKSSDLSNLAEKKCQISYGDILDLASIESAFAGAELVYHLAAKISAKSCESKQLFNVNYDGTKNVVDTCIKLDIPKLVHVSSSVTIGGSFSKTVLNEKSESEALQLNLDNFDSKRLGEEYVLEHVERSKLNAIVFNPGLIFGPMDAKKEIRQGITQVAKGKMPFYTEGGASIIDVEDVILCLTKAINRDLKGQRFLITGENLTFQELFNLVASTTSVSAPKLKLSKRLMNMLWKIERIFRKEPLLSRENISVANMYCWYDSSKAQKEFNFQPRPAKEAIVKSINWMRENSII